MFEAIHSSRTLPNPRTAIVSVTVRFRALTIIGESSASGSTTNSVVLGWLSLICWSGDLNSHQAFKHLPCRLAHDVRSDRGKFYVGSFQRLLQPTYLS